MKSFLILVLAALFWTAPAAAADVSDTVILVAPIGNGEHVGFIVNRPSGITLAQLFEIKRGAWHLLDADASLVLRKQTEGMWEELVHRAEIRANGI